MRKSAYELMSPKIEKYLSEKDRPQTVKEIAEGIGVATSSIHNVLQLMEVFKVVQKVKRMGRYRYFLKGAYDDEQLSAMFPPKIVKHIPKRRKSTTYSTRLPKSRVKKSLLEQHLSTMRMRASSGEGPSALAMIGLTQQETVEEEVLTDELPRYPEIKFDIEESKFETPIKTEPFEVEERKFETPITSEPFATVKHLPKDIRRLARGQTKYLMEQLKGLDGYEKIERFNTAFSRVSALENKKYGNTLYFSMGTNPWNNIHKVKIDPSISDFMLLPIIELKRWSYWNDFLMGLKETGTRYGMDQYDKIIDQFMESGHKLVEITMENRKANYLRNMLKKRIGERGLEEKVKASHVKEWVYLEKVE